LIGPQWDDLRRPVGWDDIQAVFALRGLAGDRLKHLVADQLLDQPLKRVSVGIWVEANYRTDCFPGPQSSAGIFTPLSAAQRCRYRVGTLGLDVGDLDRARMRPRLDNTDIVAVIAEQCAAVVKSDAREPVPLRHVSRWRKV